MTASNAVVSKPPLNRLCATDLARLLHRREVSAVDVARACLERVKERGEALGAWAFLDPNILLSQAKALDAGPVRGALHGLPVGVKDIIDTADLPTEYGSPIYRGHRPSWDAACVAALRNAGGVVMGKTVSTEFASLHPGATANPHRLAHTPGGSSSGSAAGVADFMMPLALGTQTGGSLIRPASFCGVVGYKPSFGLISRHGVKPLAESLDTVGVISRTVADIALFAAAITRRPALRDLAPIQGPRIGVWRTYEWEHASAATQDAVDAAARKLSAAGAHVAQVDMPTIFAELDRAHHVIERFEMADALAFERRNHADLLSPALRARLDDAARVAPELYEEKLTFADECRRVIAEVFGLFDVLLTPSAVDEAPEGLAHTGNAAFNRGWTLLHLPCIGLPAALGATGLPVGVQLVGGFRADRKLLSIAHWAERVLVS